MEPTVGDNESKREIDMRLRQIQHARSPAILKPAISKALIIAAVIAGFATYFDESTHHINLHYPLGEERDPPRVIYRGSQEPVLPVMELQGTLVSFTKRTWRIGLRGLPSNLVPPTVMRERVRMRGFVSDKANHVFQVLYSRDPQAYGNFWSQSSDDHRMSIDDSLTHFFTHIEPDALIASAIPTEGCLRTELNPLGIVAWSLVVFSLPVYWLFTLMQCAFAVRRINEEAARHKDSHDSSLEA